MRRIYAFLFVLTLVSWTGALAQTNLMWEELGPNNMGSHVRAVVADGTGTVWAGAVGGGLWKSTDNGLTWAIVPGIDDNLAVSSIYANGNNIYVGTGELVYHSPTMDELSAQINWSPDSSTTYRYGVFQYSGMVGEGVFVSNDGGNTWSHNNGTWNNSSTIYNNPFTSIQKISGNGNRVFIATLEGLYYSDNADLSNVTKSDGVDQFFDEMPIMDVEFSTNGVVFATTEDSLWRSTDNGATFGRSLNDSILPSSFLPGDQVGGTRIEVAVAPSDPNTIYICGVLGTNQSASGVWRSTDNGINFTRIGPKESSTFQPLQGQGATTCVLEVTPNDPNRIVLGGSNLYTYDDVDGWNEIGTQGFIPGLTTNYVPNNILSISFDPTDDSTFFVGTDKEMVGTFDYGQSFSFRTRGLNAGSMQTIHAAPDYRIVATERYHGLLYKANGASDPLSQQFTDIYPQAGGGTARISTTNLRNIISETADGGLERSINNGESWELFYGFPLDPVDACFDDSIYIDRPDTNVAGAALYDKDVAFVSPWVFDEVITPTDLQNDTNIQNTPVYLYYCGGAFLWSVTNPFGDLDSLPRWNRLSVDLTGAGDSRNPEFYTAIDVSGDNTHTILVGTNYGRIFRVTNANDPTNADCSTAMRIDTFSTGLPEGWISDISIEKGNPNNVVITYGGYSNLTERVWMSNNAMGSNPTFTNVTGNLPTNLPVYTAAIHPDAARTVIVLGTEKGAYVTGDNYNTSTSLNWTKTGVAEIGNAAVTDLYFRDYFITDFASDDYAYGIDYTLFAATNGRGCFKTRTLVSAEEPTIVEAGIGMTLSPNPSDKQSKISIELPEATDVRISVFNITGTKLGNLVDRKLAPGVHEFDFLSEQLPAGTYLFNGEFKTTNGHYFNTIKAVIAH